MASVVDGRCSVARELKETGQRLFTTHMHMDLSYSYLVIIM